jgi:cytochrome c oxidase cbb3-type subunit 4
VDVGTIRGVITVVTLVTFLGICWWAYRSGNRERFEEDGRLPFREDGPVVPGVTVRAEAREGSDE